MPHFKQCVCAMCEHRRHQIVIADAVLVERERVIGIIEQYAAPHGWAIYVNKIISRIRSGAIAEPKEGT